MRSTVAGCYPRGLMQFPNDTVSLAFAIAAGCVAAGAVLVLPLSGASQVAIVASVSVVVSAWAMFGPAAPKE